jgi:hypothetical protein
MRFGNRHVQLVGSGSGWFKSNTQLHVAAIIMKINQVLEASLLQTVDVGKSWPPLDTQVCYTFGPLTFNHVDVSMAYLLKLIVVDEPIAGTLHRFINRSKAETR